MNFCLPVKEFDSDRVTIAPFDPSVHAGPFFDAFSESSVDLWIHSTIPAPFENEQELRTWYHNEIWTHVDRVLFAVLYRGDGFDEEASELKPAGLIGLKNTSSDDLSAEIAYLVTLQPFQRKRVATRAVMLLLVWCFDLMEFDRVDWWANERNERACRTAESLGFTRDERAKALAKIDVGDLASLMESNTRMGGKEKMTHLVMKRDEWPQSRAMVEEGMRKSK